MYVLVIPIESPYASPTPVLSAWFTCLCVLRYHTALHVCLSVTEVEELAIMAEITAAKGRPELRVLVLSSPPWGVFTEEHDKAVPSNQIGVSDRPAFLCPFSKLL